MTAPRDVVWVRLPRKAAIDLLDANPWSSTLNLARDALREALARPEGDVWKGWEVVGDIPANRMVLSWEVAGDKTPVTVVRGRR